MPGFLHKIQHFLKFLVFESPGEPIVADIVITEFDAYAIPSFQQDSDVTEGIVLENQFVFFPCDFFCITVFSLPDRFRNAFATNSILR